MAERQTSARAGQYRRQPAGYAAFLPAPLPPIPPVEVDAELLTLLSDADRALGRLDGVSDLLPDPDLFVFMYVRREAVLSSQIEGTQASLVDLLEFEAERARARTPDDVAEVSNYVRAMNHGLGRLETLPVSLRLIREIHGVLLEGVRGAERSPGEFRTSQNWIGPAGCSLEEATFVPPPPGDMRDALGQFEEFLHDPAPMPILLKLGLAHAQFETIHPFLDGNGRVGRLLITFFLCERNVLRQPLLYLSIYLRRYRAEYYDRLQAVRDSGDWEGWLKFFLRGVREVAREATGTAREIMQLREDHRVRIGEVFGRSAASASRVLEALYRQPLVTVSMVSELTGLSYARANSIVDTLAQQGLVIEVTGRRRDRLFRFESYLALFQEDA